MRPYRSTLLSATAALGVVALLAGCSGGDGADAGKLTYEDSPLTEVLSAVNRDFDEDHWEKQQLRVEELVAKCMADEGFEYTPVDHSQNSMSFDDTDWEERQTEEWIAKNGWGMVQTEEEMKEQQAQANEFVDPNQPYVESLSPSEQEAYWETLHGPQPTEEELEDGTHEYDWSTAGCYGASQHEIDGEQGGNYWEDEEFKPLTDAMNSMWEKVQKSEEVRELDRAWSECMAEAGYDGLAARADAQNQVNDELNKVWENTDPENPEPDYSGLDELKQVEIDTALADFRCAKGLDYEQAQLRAQFAIEEQFIEDHRSELDALIAAYGSKK